MATERYDKRIDRDEDHNYFQKYAEIILPKVTGSVVDVGCGQGWLTKLMSEKADYIIAYDKFTDQPEENKAKNILYRKIDIKDLVFTGKFDTIVSTEFIEHIPKEDLEVLLDKIYKALKHSGHFLGSTPNVPVPSGNPYHVQEYTTEELEKLFAEHGLIGRFYNPLPYLTVWETWQQRL